MPAKPNWFPQWRFYNLEAYGCGSVFSYINKEKVSQPACVLVSIQKLGWKWGWGLGNAIRHVFRKAFTFKKLSTVYDLLMNTLDSVCFFINKRWIKITDESKYYICGISFYNIWALLLFASLRTLPLQLDLKWSSFKSCKRF